MVVKLRSQELRYSPKTARGSSQLVTAAKLLRKGPKRGGTVGQHILGKNSLAGSIPKHLQLKEEDDLEEEDDTGELPPSENTPCQGRQTNGLDLVDGSLVCLHALLHCTFPLEGRGLCTLASLCEEAARPPVEESVNPRDGFATGFHVGQPCDLLQWEPVSGQRRVRGCESLTQNAEVRKGNDFCRKENRWGMRNGYKSAGGAEVPVTLPNDFTKKIYISANREGT